LGSITTRLERDFCGFIDVASDFFQGVSGSEKIFTQELRKSNVIM